MSGPVADGFVAGDRDRGTDPVRGPDDPSLWSITSNGLTSGCPACQSRSPRGRVIFGSLRVAEAAPLRVRGPRSKAPVESDNGPLIHLASGSARGWGATLGVHHRGAMRLRAISRNVGRHFLSEGLRPKRSSPSTTLDPTLALPGGMEPYRPTDGGPGSGSSERFPRAILGRGRAPGEPPHRFRARLTRPSAPSRAAAKPRASQPRSRGIRSGDAPRASGPPILRGGDRSYGFSR